MDTNVKNTSGRVLFDWDMKNVYQLLDMIRDNENAGEHIDMTSLPCAPEFKERVFAHAASYPIWACDTRGRCLVGVSADEIEYISGIESTY